MEALESWKEEKRSAYIYRALSALEVNPVHQTLFLDLSKMAEKQALIWEKQLKATHVPIPKDYSPDWRVRIVLKLVQCFGVRALRIALAAMKIRGMSIYHGVNFHHPTPVTPHEMEHRHRGVSSGNNLRAAIFGINDGLVSNASLILGMVGAHASLNTIILSGVAGLLAGACSMGAGEYISVRSQREMLEYQLALEKSELELYPEEEAMELALIYEARGLPMDEAKRFSELLIQNPDRALDTLAREELGINPDELVSPWGAMFASFVAFAIGAVVPLLPFLIHRSYGSIPFSIALSMGVLFVVGAALSLFTQRSALWGGTRMLLIGAAAGGLTYFIGNILMLGGI